MNVLAGSTDVTTYFALRLAADGTDATGLTITNFDLQYVRSGAAPAAKVDATALAATDSAHGDNQAIEIDATDQPGLYRVDWPDAAFAAGVREVILTVKCATAFTEHLRVNLTPVPANTVQVSSDSTAADTMELFAEALDQTTGQIDSGTFAAGAITAAAIANGAIDAATFAADVDAEILSYLVDDATRIDASALNTASVTSIPAILEDTGTTLQAELDGIQADTEDIQTRLPAALTAGGLIKADVQGLVNNADAISGLETLALDYFNNSSVGANVLTLTAGAIASIQSGLATAAAVADVPTNAELATAITTGLTTALTEGYRNTDATGSVRDLLYEILQNITEFAISGTTKTVKKLDGATTAKTYTLDDATTPTSITEST